MTKKDPVLWVVVDKDGVPWSVDPKRKVCAGVVPYLTKDAPAHAPFRVVKYVPAPKPKKRKTK